MEYRELGRTGVKVSALCLGTMTWGQQNTEAEGHAQMDYALAQGINFFDTSEMYAVPPKPETQGSTERIIGSWFKARGTREKVILATKVAGRSPMNWLRKDGATTEQTPKQIAEAIESSLKRLQTDRIDLYQLHWPDRPMPMFGASGLAYKHIEGTTVPIADILGALQDHVKAGKIRWIGLSNETAWGTMSFVHHAVAKGLPRVQSIQNAYSLINRTFEMGLAEVAHREQVGLLAYSPLAQGYLTGKYQGGASPAGSRKALFNRLQRYEKPETEPAIDRYLAIARQFGLDPAQLALKFVTTRPFVTSNIIGATTMAQLKTNVGSDQVTWSDELERLIDAAHHAQPNPAPWMIRLFTAIELPESVRMRLTLLQGGVPGARWSPTENLHLTLRFIGEVDEAAANDIDDVLSTLKAAAFDLTLKGAGEFGGRDPHALWIGVAPSEPLLRLAAKIESALQRMGLEAETRKYTPHVTVARLRDAPLAKVREFVSAHSLFDSGPFAVRAFALYSSHQSSSGSLYRPERTYALD